MSFGVLLLGSSFIYFWRQLSFFWLLGPSSCLVHLVYVSKICFLQVKFFSRSSCFALWKLSFSQMSHDTLVEIAFVEKAPVF